MKKSLRLIYSFFVLLTLTVFSGCELGMGASVDLEAPVITITSPLPHSNVKRSVLLEGTCKDNLRVTEVTVTNKITGEEYGKAEIKGETWSKQLYLDEGEVELVCQAKDAKKNASTKSISTILLLVDETAPEGLSWYIERGKGIQISLQSKEALMQTNLDEPTNKYIPQNQEFTIHGNFYDAMSIDTITLTLSENGKRIISKTIEADSASPNYVGDGKSIFAPAFKFTHQELKEASSTLDSGKHYLQVSFSCQDNHKNTTEQNLSYLIWYPESDFPGIMQATTINNNLSVNVGTSIFLHFFDDDELEELSWDFITEAAFDADPITQENITTRKDSFTNKVPNQQETLNGTSDYPTQVSAGDITGVFYLLAYAKDVNGEEKARIIRTVVADASFPMLVIEKPVENAVPEIKENTTSTFEITGYSYDTAGSKNIKIAYIPDVAPYDTPAKREARAKEIFSGEATPSANEKYQTYTFPANKTKNPEDTWYIEDFSFNFDVLTFGDEKKSKKFFEIALEDTDGNIVYKQFNVGGDSKDPEITIKSPADNMIVCDYRNSDLLLKFKAEKPSGLGIETSKYKIERKDYEDTISWTSLTPDAQGYVSVTIPKATLKNWAEGLSGFASDTQPVFVFYAEDVLGNDVTEQRTVVLSPLPVLEKVMADTISGTYPAGKEIIIQAKFSDSVRVTGNPRIKLGGIKLADGSDPTTPYYADYDSGSLSDTLSFKFTVPEDVKATKLVCVDVNGGIDLNGGTIVTNVEGTGNASITFAANQNFWDAANGSEIQKTIALDGIAPVIQSITPKITGVVKNSDGNWYVNANKDIELEVEFSEAVLVSGSPVITYNGIGFTFKSMQDDTVTFIHTVLSEENKTLSIGAAGFTDPVRAAIKDSAGNEIKQGSPATQTVVVDTTKPGTPAVHGVTDGVYNVHPTISVTAASDNNDTDVLEYSTNGGLSWKQYTTPYQIPETGNFIITARSTDKAGNVSDPSTGIEITINDTFPAVNEISIARADGKYKENTIIDFKVFLQDEVQPYAGGEASLTFTGIEEGTSITRTVPCLYSDVATNKIIFRYLVRDDDFIKGVKINSVTLGNIQDKYTNKSSTATTTKINALLQTTECNRTGILLDGVAPQVSTYKLGDSSVYTYGTDVDKVSSATNTANSFTVTLIFDERVIKESGTITLQRKGDWAIPPVMDSKTFLKWYNKIQNDADKQKLIQKDSAGVEITDSLTGQPVGPYKKITHGLVDSGSTVVPDKATKYVLDFQYGLYDTTGTVKDIRDVLSSVDYDKHFVEVRNVTVNNNTVTITFPDVIEDGQNWELVIPDNSFHDETGNYFKGFKTDAFAESGDYKFSLWSNNVAKPVVRVDRYSHGMGAYGLNASGAETQITGWTTPNAATYTDSSGSNLKPLGYARVRIDCETPEAKIYYKNIAGGTALSDDYRFWSKNVSEQRHGNWPNYTYTLNVTEKDNEDDTHISSIADISKTSLIFSTGGTEYSGTINVGDTSTDAARYKTARKDYVSAYATKSGFTQSANGYEGVFKTVLIIYKGNHNAAPSETDHQINIEGGTAEGGEPIVSGFPVRDATSDHRYAKNAYYFSESYTYSVPNTDNLTNQTYTDSDFFAWVSYDIISDWAVLQHRSNYSSKYPKHTYGQVLFLSNYSTWE